MVSITLDDQTELGTPTVVENPDTEFWNKHKREEVWSSNHERNAPNKTNLASGESESSTSLKRNWIQIVESELCCKNKS